MKRLLIQIIKIREQIENKIDDRETTFFNRSDDWQESDKGQDHEDKTDELRDAMDALQEVEDSLDTYLN